MPTTIYKRTPRPCNRPRQYHSITPQITPQTTQITTDLPPTNPPYIEDPRRQIINIMKMKLDPWQEEVLAHKGDLGLCTGRRVGKTYILARKAVDHMVKFGKPIIVVSLTEEQAQIILQMALNYAREEYPKLIGKGKYAPHMKDLTIMKNKKPILMRSRPVGNTGDSTRGFEGGVLIVDEASRMPRFFWIAAKPILLTCAGEIWMCSTPFGKQGYFWESFNKAWNLKDPKARFKFFYKTSEEVGKERPISESWTKEQKEGWERIIQEDKEEMSDIEYGQEYLGLFLDEILQLFSDDWIEAVCTLPVPEMGGATLPRDAGRDLFLGVDVGRVIDPSTFEGLDGTDEDNIKQIYHSEIRKLTIPGTFREIRRLERIYSFNRIGIDSTGMGAGVLDLLIEDDETSGISEGMENAVKVIDDEDKTKPLLGEDMWMNLLALGDLGKIKLFKNLEIMASLKSIRQVYVGNRTKIDGDNSHSGEGLKRAAYLIKQKLLKPFFARC